MVSVYQAGGTVAMLLIGMLLGALLWVAYRLLFAFAAYHDAKAKDNPDALLWGLLIGFLGLIPGIIYLCIRNSGRKYVRCPNCGCMHFAWEPHCPQCGTQSQPGYPANPYAALYGEKARKELIAGIIVAVGGTIFYCVWILFHALVFLR